jgi:WD40 repeat protein
VTGGENGMLHVLSFPGGDSSSRARKVEQLEELQSIQSSSTVLEIKRSPAFDWIVISAHKHGVCSMWDMHQSCLMASFVRILDCLHVGLVSLDFHHTGNRLVTASEDNIVCIWQCDSIINNHQQQQATQQSTRRKSKRKSAQSRTKPTVQATPTTLLPKVEHLPMFCTSLSRTHVPEVSPIDCVLFFQDLIFTRSMNYICLWHATIKPIVLLGKAQVMEPSELGVMILFEFRLDFVEYHFTKCHCSNTTLAAGTGHGQVYLWDLEKIYDDDDEGHDVDDEVDTIGLEPTHILSMVLQETSTVRTVQFSPDGQHLVATNDDGYLGLWKL